MRAMPYQCIQYYPIRCAMSRHRANNTLLFYSACKSHPKVSSQTGGNARVFSRNHVLIILSVGTYRCAVKASIWGSWGSSLAPSGSLWLHFAAFW